MGAAAFRDAATATGCGSADAAGMWPIAAFRRDVTAGLRQKAAVACVGVLWRAVVCYALVSGLGSEALCLLGCER